MNTSSAFNSPIIQGKRASSTQYLQKYEAESRVTFTNSNSNIAATPK